MRHDDQIKNLTKLRTFTLEVTGS